MIITETVKAHFFNTDATLGTGLAPTCSIYCYDDGADVATDAAMTEDRRGFYSYQFNRDLEKHYEVVCDSKLDNGFRYAISSIDPSPLAHLVEGSITAQHALAVLLAYMANKRTGGGKTTLHYRNNADSVDRILQTVNSRGEVSAVTLDFSDI